jgi:GNAT superfamily N-acetyltransferase
MSWLFTAPDRRRAGLPRFFAALTRHHLLAAGGVQVAAGEVGIGAAALGAPPGRWQETLREQAAMAPAMLRAFRGRLGAARELAERMKGVHPEEPHWYLAVIGSDPEVRGAGFGRALMEAGLQRCDAEGAPAYLESSNPENIPYYHRFGFDVIGEIAAPGGGPALWPMWRPPR